MVSSKAEEWYKQGYEEQDMVKAIEYYTKALEIDPTYAEAWMRKGILLNLLKRYEEAISCYDKALEIHPSDHHVMTIRKFAEENLEGQKLPLSSKVKELVVDLDFSCFEDLFKLYEVEGEDVVSEIAGLLDRNNCESRGVTFAPANAAFALSEIEKAYPGAIKDAVPNLISLLNDDSVLTSKSTFSKITGALGEVAKSCPECINAAIPKLAKLLKDEDPNIRINATFAIAYVADNYPEVIENSISDLISSLSDPYPEDAIHALRGAGRKFPEEIEDAIPRLIELLDDEDSDVCISAATNLIIIRKNHKAVMEKYADYAKQKIQKLTSLLEDEDSDIREDAAYAISAIGPLYPEGAEERIPKLIRLLGDVEESGSRWAAAYALGEEGAVEALNPLKKLLKDEDSSLFTHPEKGESDYLTVGEMAQEAIKKISYNPAKEHIESSDFISSIESEIAEIKNSGIKTPKLDKVIEHAQSELKQNNFERAKELTKEAKRIALERKERYNLASDSLSASEKVFNEAKEFGCNVLDFEDRLTNVEQLFDEGAYEEVIETSKQIGELVKKIREEAKPEIKISLSQTSFKANAWKRIDNIITNTGTATAKEIKVEYPKERVEIEGLMAAEELKPNEEKTLKLTVRPIHEGEVPLTATITYMDLDNKEYKEEKTFWISVGTEISTEAEVGVEDQKPIIKRETEFFSGFIRLKISVTNTMSQIITDVSLDLDFDENTLRLDRHEPEYAVKKGKALLGTISPDTGKTVAFYLDPMTCTKAGTEINCRVDYKDAYGKSDSTRMERKKVKVVCPIFSTESDINIGMLKDFIEHLPCHDSKVYQIPAGLDKDKLVELCRETIQMHDVRHIRTLRTTDDKTCETWYYGKTKVDKNNIVINACINEETESIEIFAATPAPESLTGLLAELGRSLTKKINVTGKKPEQVVNVSMKDVIIQRSNLLKFCDADGVCSEENIIIEDSVIQRSKIGGVAADASNVAVEGTVVQPTEIEEDEEVELQEERLRKKNEERERLRREEEEKKKERERKEREEAEERELEKQAYHRLYQEMDEIKEKRLKRGN